MAMVPAMIVGSLPGRQVRPGTGTPTRTHTGTVTDTTMRMGIPMGLVAVSGSRSG